MSFQFNGLTASVSVTGQLSASIPDMPSGATRVNKNFNSAIAIANTAYTVYTPAGGKTLYITDLYISNSLTTTSVLRVGDNISGNANQPDTLLTGACHMGGQYTFTNFHFTVPMSIATALKVICANTGNAFISFSGWEI